MIKIWWVQVKTKNCVNAFIEFVYIRYYFLFSFKKNQRNIWTSWKNRYLQTAFECLILKNTTHKNLQTRKTLGILFLPILTLNSFLIRQFARSMKQLQQPSARWRHKFMLLSALLLFKSVERGSRVLTYSFEKITLDDADCKTRLDTIRTIRP